MSKQIIVNDGGKVNQSISTTVEKPASVSVGPVQGEHDNVWIAVVCVLIIAVAWTVVRKWYKKDKR